MRLRFTHILTVALTILGVLVAPTAVASAATTSGTFTTPGGSFATQPAQLRDYGCFYHPYTVTFETDPMGDGWSLEVRVLAPNGTIFDSASKIGTLGAAYGSFKEEMFFCSSLDVPGTYTITGTVTSYYGGGSRNWPMTPLSFEVLPVPKVDVTGTVKKRSVDRGARFTFRSQPLPVGTVQGRGLLWKVVYDGRVRRVRQNADERDVVTLKFPRGSGKHRIKIWRNGQRALTTVVTVK